MRPREAALILKSPQMSALEKIIALCAGLSFFGDAAEDAEEIFT